MGKAGRYLTVTSITRALRLSFSFRCGHFSSSPSLVFVFIVFFFDLIRTLFSFFFCPPPSPPPLSITQDPLPRTGLTGFTSSHDSTDRRLYPALRLPMPILASSQLLSHYLLSVRVYLLYGWYTTYRGGGQDTRPADDLVSNPISTPPTSPLPNHPPPEGNNSYSYCFLCRMRHFDKYSYHPDPQSILVHGMAGLPGAPSSCPWWSGQ
ncbi:hypothetical protein BO86DRAFT_189090 [Aspergillus japonicus CBS 114.51]|uniref:Uncharacterized protein n=1 Tax=Aspergillus japonicus CBS 114.51 TaxID=1448312 RepID=A0A8T8XBG6_ASPJA|nr:hypothetical protein BO86DRAFT_189090 [Aspergillus japonicus CBS 114.51]RAH85340.1 hypothetical protein BO86DRAFT_189090 [Aspergillus japonicus CBS 114.51]